MRFPESPIDDLQVPPSWRLADHAGYRGRSPLRELEIELFRPEIACEALDENSPGSLRTHGFHSGTNASGFVLCHVG